jgi:hypothetical protein
MTPATVWWFLQLKQGTKKIDKLDFMKIKNFGVPKDTIKR